MKSKKLTKFAGLLLAGSLICTMAVPNYAFAAASEAVQTEVSEVTADGIEISSVLPALLASDGISVSDETSLKSAISDASVDSASPTVIIVQNSIELSSALEIPAGKYVSIQGANTSVSISAKTSTEAQAFGLSANNSLIDVSGTLTLSNITLDANKEGRVMYLTSTGKCTLNSGAVITGGYILATNINIKNFGAGIFISQGAVLEMNDGAYIKGNAIDGDFLLNGAGVCDIGTFYMNGGTISNNTMLSGRGSAVAVGETTTYTAGKFYMSGDSRIENNSITSDNTINLIGGAISVYNNSICEISGGYIQYNTQGIGNGCAIYARAATGSKIALSDVVIKGNSCKNGYAAVYHTAGDLTLKNVTIEENTASVTNAGLYDTSTGLVGMEGYISIKNNTVAGNAKNMYRSVTSPRILTLTGALDSNSSIGLSTNMAETVYSYDLIKAASGQSQDILKASVSCFYNDDESNLCYLEYSEENQAIQWKRQELVRGNAFTITESDGEAGLRRALLSASMEQDESGNVETTVITLTTDIVLTKTLSVYEGTNVKIVSADKEKPYTISTSSSLTSMASIDGSLTLENVTMDGNVKSRIVTVNNGGSLTLNNGAVLAHGCVDIANGTQGGAVYVNSGATLTMKDGSAITGVENSEMRTVYGLAVYNDGTFRMEGGTISNNKVTYEKTGGISVYVYGTVYNAGGSNFAMTGGTISDNLSYGYGGAVYNYGSATIGGDALISGNYAGRGGAVYNALSLSKLYIEDNAQITGNSALLGGGIYMQFGTMQMTGGVISGNEAKVDESLEQTGNGAGIYMLGGNFTLSGGRISDNVITGMENIKDAELQGHGGGIFIRTNEYGNLTRVYLNGGIIEGNQAADGQGIYVANYTLVANTTPAISGSTSAASAPNYTDYANKNQIQIYVSGAPQVLDKMLIRKTAYLEYSKEEDAANNQMLYPTVLTISGPLSETVTDESGNETVQSAQLHISKEVSEYTSWADDDTFGLPVTDAVVAAAGTDVEITQSDLDALIVEPVSETGFVKKSLTEDGKITEQYFGEDEITVTIEDAEYVFDGSAKEPEVTVIVTEEPLTEGIDYSVFYENNINAGTATVKVTGIGNYAGTVNAEFEILDIDRWMKNSTGYWYQHADGTYTTSDWELINGKWYYFDKNGYMMYGWQKINDKWYYLGAANDGAMKTGWQQISGKWYYMNSNGVMQTGWQKIDGKWYYMNSNGVMQTGWQQISDKWYYMNSNGVMQTGWQKIDGKWYYMNSNGVMQTGWVQVGSNWYYFYSSGVMASNTWVGNYYLKASGAMARSEWVDNGKYYVDQNGVWVPGK